jgi:hypothetical protein
MKSAGGAGGAAATALYRKSKEDRVRR